MFSEQKIKTILKSIFLLLQISILFSGITSFIICTALYFKIGYIFNYRTKSMIPLLFLSTLSIVNGIFGMMCISSKKKIKVFFFVLSLISLMDIQIVIAFKSNKLVENNKSWMNDRWNMISNEQKNFLETKFKCCGFETRTDRNSSGCKFKNSCYSELNEITIKLRDFIQRFLIALFLIESVSLCVFSFLKFGK